MENEHFPRSRSSVYCNKYCCASSQPLASQCGLRVLDKGGNAADAAIAMAAALNVTEPCSTGIGGDCFVLFYSAKRKEVRCLMGNGASPASLDLGLLSQLGFCQDNPLPPDSPHTVVVPGAAAGWWDTVSLFGSKRLTMAEVLQDPISLALNGAVSVLQIDSPRFPRRPNRCRKLEKVRATPQVDQARVRNVAVRRASTSSRSSKTQNGF